jgi:uncharacterized membrane protein
MDDDLNMARWLFTQPLLRMVVIATALSLITFAAFEAARIAVVTDGLARTSAFVGVLVAAQGAAALRAA